MASTLPPHQTFTYKTVGTCPIRLDLYLPPKKSSNTSSPTPTPIPILVWFHGGGLLQGSRTGIKPHTLAVPDRYNVALVSADYRLAPQVQMPSIVSDVKDCLRFVARELPSKVSSSSSESASDENNVTLLDPTRIAVSGSSAGGYLAFLAGLYCAEDGDDDDDGAVPIKVLLPIYPITDPLGPFFTTPQQPVKEFVDRDVVAPFLDPDAEVMSENDPARPRQKMYQYMLGAANLAELLGVTEGDDRYVVPRMLRSRTRSKGGFPPTYMVHGDSDGFVGVEQADEVADILKDIGVDYVYDRLPGLDHLFDVDPKYDLASMYQFMMKYL